MKALTFGDALAALKQGKRVARDGWNGKGMWLALQTPDQHSKITLPYIYIEYPELTQVAAEFLGLPHKLTCSERTG
jgi:hypothetical protein